MDNNKLQLRRVNAIQYVTPLREGGSLPAIVGADDGFMYVMKFKGAGQGSRALISELIGGELARAIGLRMPEIVLIDLDVGFGRSEGDEEIQDLLKFSEGLNLGLHYLKGAITYDPAVYKIDPIEASKIVWLDAFITNVDRTARNTNMLIWNDDLWLIDHGAALYFHHHVTDVKKQAETPFARIKDHVLLQSAIHVKEVNDEILKIITPDLIVSIVDLLPDEWLIPNDQLTSSEEMRSMYKTFLTHRLENHSIFLNTLING